MRKTNEQIDLNKNYRITLGFTANQKNELVALTKMLNDNTTGIMRRAFHLFKFFMSNPGHRLVCEEKNADGSLQRTEIKLF